MSMDEKQMLEQFRDRHPGYRLQELVRFGYPMRLLDIDLTINTTPDLSLVSFYQVLLGAIDIGYTTTERLFGILGFTSRDAFVLNELIRLRDEGYLDQVSGKWKLTAAGRGFLENSSVMRVLEKARFRCYTDGLDGALVLAGEEFREGKRTPELCVKAEVELPRKSPLLLKGKLQQVDRLFRVGREDGAKVEDIGEGAIDEDREVWLDRWFLEYAPEEGDAPPIVEVRKASDGELDEGATKNAQEHHASFLNQLSISERGTLSLMESKMAEQLASASTSVHNEHIIRLNQADPRREHPVHRLDIWETKEAFVDALRNVQHRILIESPWIKRATRQYVPHFRSILAKGRTIYLLYGIQGQDEHDEETLKDLREMQANNVGRFMLVHLPSYPGVARLSFIGTHCKRLIKDDDFYLITSFNFLSKGQRKGQAVANEATVKVTVDVQGAWESVQREYGLRFAN
jgi:hypothetical protein